MKEKTEVTSNLENLEKNLGYKFKDTFLLVTAITHSSFANESKKELKNNERLEFLGDSVLSVIVSEYIFKNYPNLKEGKLSASEFVTHRFNIAELGKALAAVKAGEALKILMSW